MDAAGAWVYMSVLTDDGWEVARVPYDPASWSDPLPVDARFDPREAGTVPLPSPAVPDSLSGSDAREYSGISSLTPRFWLPIREEPRSVVGQEVLPTAWGARTSGSDLVGRHEYEARVAQAIGASRSRGEWGASYAWSGLGNPTVLVESGQAWSVGGSLLVPGGGVDQETAAPDTVIPLLRERSFGSALVVRRHRIRSAARFSLGARRIFQRRHLVGTNGETSDRLQPVRTGGSLNELRLSGGYSTARAYAFSVSTENGIQLAVSLRERWDRSVPDSLQGRAGGDGSFREGVASVSGFHGFGGPGYSNHVLAVRAAVGLADGPGSGIGHFEVGGGAGDGRGVVGLALGNGARQFPVRGISAGDERGNKAWSLTTEWRFPISLIHAGLGAWPVHVDRIAGSLFLDIAGTRREAAESVTGWRSVSSVGAELMVFGSLFFEEVDRIRVGLAVPLEAPTGQSDSPSIYVQTGWSF